MIIRYLDPSGSKGGPSELPETLDLRRLGLSVNTSGFRV